MPIITSKGYKLPQKGEKVTWWQNIVDNFVRVNNHTHDGTDSQLIKASSLTKEVQDILAADWINVSISQIPFYQLVTMPSGIDFDKTVLQFRNSANGNIVYPMVTKVSSTSFNIFVNDNTLNLKVIYG